MTYGRNLNTAAARNRYKVKMSPEEVEEHLKNKRAEVKKLAEIAQEILKAEGQKELLK